MTPRPPSVPGLPLIGNTIAVLRDPVAFLLRAYRDLGPAYRVSVFGQRFTIMAGREALQFLTTVGEAHFSRASFYERFAQELGAREFILGLQGERHRQLGKSMRLGFSRQVAAPFVPAMIEGTRATVRAWAGQALRVPDAMARLAFDAYCLVMAGRSLPDHFRDAQVYSETIMRVGAQVRPALLLRLPRYRRARRRVFALVRGLLDEHRVDGGSPNREYDLFDALVDESRDDPALFTDDDIIATALYGFVGTLVYLNRVLAYLLYELLKDQALRDRVTAEADAFLTGGDCTARGLRQMRTLRYAYLETLRFHPVALGLLFLVEEEFEFCGCRIATGDKVILSPLPVHFSEASYTMPHGFDCGRCAPPRHENQAAGAFAPFGFAGRVCGAAGLVELITLATMATVLHTVDLRLEPPDYTVRTRVDPLPGPETRFTVRVGGLRAPARVAPVPPAVEEIPALVTAEPNSASWGALLSKVASTRYDQGAVIIREGEAAEHFFILTEGQVEVFTDRGPDGAQRLATLGPGEYFGEIGLLRRVPRTATVRAITAVNVLVVDRKTFVGMIAESDLLSEQIAEAVRKRMTATRLAGAFPHLTTEHLGRLLPNVRLVTYAAGAPIVRQGDTADAFYIVARGRVDVHHRSPAGREQVLQQLGPGEWFGEIGLLSGAPRTATVQVSGDGDADVLVLSKNDFRALMGESAQTQMDLWATMSHRLSQIESGP